MHDGVSACKRRGELPRRDQEREVPGRDRGDDTERLAHAVREDARIRRVGRPRDLGRPAGEVHPRTDGERDVALRLADRLADVARLERRELVGARLEQLAEPLEDPASLERIDLRPPGLRGTSGLHGLVDVLGIASRERRDRQRRRRIDVVERRAGSRGHLIAADQVPAAFRPGDHRAGVSSGCAASAFRSTSAT